MNETGENENLQELRFTVSRYETVAGDAFERPTFESILVLLPFNLMSLLKLTHFANNRKTKEILIACVRIRVVSIEFVI